MLRSLVVIPDDGCVAAAATNGLLPLASNKVTNDNDDGDDKNKPQTLLVGHYAERTCTTPLEESLEESRGGITSGVGKLGGYFSFTAVLLISTVTGYNGVLYLGFPFLHLNSVEIQGGPSGFRTQFVGSKLNVLSQYKLLIISSNLLAMSTKRCPRPDLPPL